MWLIVPNRDRDIAAISQALPKRKPAGVKALGGRGDSGRPFCDFPSRSLWRKYPHFLIPTLPFLFSWLFGSSGSLLITVWISPFLPSSWHCVWHPIRMATLTTSAWPSSLCCAGLAWIGACRSSPSWNSSSCCWSYLKASKTGRKRYLLLWPGDL